jgi:hypothetical protein
VDIASNLIEEDELRNYISLNNFSEIASGRFSIARRNEQMKRIYAEAIK